jgi:two-component system, OmpR family, sensor histidine kinase MprB
VTLRSRLTLVAAAVVALVLAAASLTVYLLVRHDLRSQVDTTLKRHAAEILRDPEHAYRPDFINNDTVQVVDDSGAAIPPYPGGPQYLPIDKALRGAATGAKTHYFIRDVTIQGVHAREVVVPVANGAIAVARPLAGVDRELRRLRLILILVCVGGIAVAAAGGALVSRTTLAPVRRLTHAAERIAETGDPSERVTTTGGGELARLGTAFNTMLAALEESLETQRRFVADASHELRTPLTSLQTNIEVLKLQERLDPEQRARLFADLEREAHEMRDLITGLLELARGDANLERETVQFDEIVESAVDRARTRFPNVHFNAHIQSTVVEGIPVRLERAVWNLLENAGKWTVPGSSVDVTLESGELRVRDHGPGIAPEDRVRVFDRFYRAATARSLPGSGLGLAIVREVAETHGGTVVADTAPGGGALMRLRLPVLSTGSSATDSMDVLHRALPDGGSSAVRRPLSPGEGAGPTASPAASVTRLRSRLVRRP